MSSDPQPDDSPLPLTPGAGGDAVLDVQRRLRAIGLTIDPDERGTYGPSTRGQIETFQTARGLVVDGICGTQTWAALVEAGFRLGDRLLYHRSPMLRGDDVAELQRQLCALGFDAWRVDGIFGPRTEQALRDFQRNSGLTTDAVCGRDTLAMLRRLGDRTLGDATVAEVRQHEDLRRTARQGIERLHLVVGESGGLEAFLDAVAKHLAAAGGEVVALHQPDGSQQAREANAADAAVYLGFEVVDRDEVSFAYFSTEGFTSIGGRALAAHLVRAFDTLGLATPVAVGMRLPVLRETRMPAVRCSLGPAPALVPRLETLALAVTDAIRSWVAEPAGPPAKG